MKKILLAFLIVFAVKTFGQCSMSFVPSYTPETCLGCCDGKISGTINNACPPFTGFLMPGNIPWSFLCCWQNLCSGIYTVVIQGACCNAVCTVTLSFGTSVKENSFSDSHLKTFPNPVSNTLNIIVDQEIENSEIEITNYLGQTVLKLPYSNTIDISKLSQGFYNLKIISMSKLIYYSKFIKE